VVGPPLRKIMKFVSWDDEIPNIWNIKFHGSSHHQPAIGSTKLPGPPLGDDSSHPQNPIQRAPGRVVCAPTWRLRRQWLCRLPARNLQKRPLFCPGQPGFVFDVFLIMRHFKGSNFSMFNFRRLVRSCTVATSNQAI
jgi:hypothetical protein